MEKNNEFSYTKNGVTIVFNELPKKEYQKEPYFEFEAQGDPDLTEKLKKSVINTQVKKESFSECAGALFEIITLGEFEEVTTKERTRAAFENFEELTHEEPKFVVKRVSTHPPKVQVTLINSNGLQGLEAQARNVLTAKVLVLEMYVNIMG